MIDFNENEVSLQHERLADRQGYLRLTHQPSGLFVDASLTTQPVLQVKRELMEALRRKVLTHLEDQAVLKSPAEHEVRPMPQTASA